MAQGKTTAVVRAPPHSSVPFTSTPQPLQPRHTTVTATSRRPRRAGLGLESGVDAAEAPRVATAVAPLALVRRITPGATRQTRRRPSNTAKKPEAAKTAKTVTAAA